jgi:hypothetical protein
MYRLTIEALFGELPLEAVASATATTASRLFIEARESLARGDASAAQSAFEEITRLPNVASLERIQAWRFLRQLGIRPSSSQEKTLLGVILEVGMGTGGDVLGVFADLTAHYYNHSGAAAIWMRPDSSLDQLTRQVVDSATNVVQKTGPWLEPRRPAVVGNQLRINMLTPGGLHFGERPFEALDQDPIARPVVQAATQLMLALTALATA